MEPKDSTGNQAVAPCVSEEWEQRSGIQHVRLCGCTRGGVWCFLLGPTESVDRRKGANEVMQHREGVWYLCNVPEMWHQGTSLQIPDCQAFSFFSPPTSTGPGAQIHKSQILQLLQMRSWMLRCFLPMSKRTFSENISRSHMTAKLALMVPLTVQCHHMEILHQVFLLSLTSHFTHGCSSQAPWDGHKGL